MKTITLTDDELDVIVEAVTLQRDKLDKFLDEQHHYTQACNLMGYRPEASASALLEGKLQDNLRDYEHLLDVLETLQWQTDITPFEQEAKA